MPTLYTVYILKCADGTLYTGITTDLQRRIAEHNGDTLGAKYTRTRRPIVLAYSKVYPDRSTALKEEFRIKSLSKAAKSALILEDKR